VNASDVAATAGLALIAAGLALIYIPVALVAAGAAIVALTVLGDRPARRRRR
jgi:hypothetical protein